MVGCLKATSGGMPALVDRCLVLSLLTFPTDTSVCLLGYLSGYRKCGGKEDILKGQAKSPSQSFLSKQEENKRYSHPKSILPKPQIPMKTFSQDCYVTV